jgi:Zinc finger, C2H2 type
MSKYECDKCNRYFASKQSLRYHDEKNVCERMKKYACNICDKELSSSYSLYRHKNTVCKDKIETDKIVCREESQMSNRDIDMTKIYDLLIKMKEENEELKVKVTRMEKAPSVNNITNNNCNINNGTVNNYFLVGYGQEDMTKIDNNELLRCIKTGFHSTYNLIDTVHFNPKYPEFHNVYISSMKNQYAMMYDGNDWTLVMKDELIDKLYNNKRDYIEENLDEFICSLTKSQVDALYRWMDTDDDNDYIRKVKNKIKLLLYNKKALAINNKGKIIECNTEIYDDDDDIEDIDLVTVPKKTKVVQKKKLKTAPRNGSKRKILKVRRSTR